MKHNNAKNEMMEDLDHVMGLLISLRTVETSPLSSNHWVNPYIDHLSNIKYQAMDNQDQCEACDGSGADYPLHAESIHDAEPCPQCKGFGFSSNETAAVILREIAKNLENKGSTRLKNLINELLAKPLYQV